jgi:hypothetical protein
MAILFRAAEAEAALPELRARETPAAALQAAVAMPARAAVAVPPAALAVPAPNGTLRTVQAAEAEGQLLAVSTVPAAAAATPE